MHEHEQHEIYDMIDNKIPYDYTINRDHNSIKVILIANRFTKPTGLCFKSESGFDMEP